MIVSSLRRHPRTSSALINPAGSCTYGQLIYGVDRLTATLPQLPGRTGRIGLVMTPEHEAVAALLATEAVELSAVLLSPALHPAAMREYTERAGASHVLLPPAARGLRSDLDIVGRVSHHGGMLSVELPKSRRGVPSPESWLLKLTSGSLGPPRLTARSRQGIAMEIEAVTHRIALSEGDTVLCASSLAHSYGLVGGLLASLSAGATVVLPGAAKQLVALTTATRPTIIFGLSSTYEQLLTVSALSRVRLALCAGAPLSPHLFQRFLQRFGIPIRQDYGTTETGTIAIDTTVDPAPSVAGGPLPHLDVRLAPSTHPPLMEIQVRSPAVAHAYITQEGAISSLDADGWYHTGDGGSLNEKGRLLLQGRIRPRIRIGAAEIAPEEIETCILALPGVEEVAVLGVVGADGAQRLKIVVAPRLDEELLDRWCADELPANAQPVIVEMRETLPRSPAGKLLLHELQ